MAPVLSWATRRPLVPGDPMGLEMDSIDVAPLTPDWKRSATEHSADAFALDHSFSDGESEV